MESTIFAGAVTSDGSGLFRRKAGQTEWQALSKGLPDRVKVYSILEGQGRTLFVGAHQGVFRSDDGGENWTDTKVPADEPPGLFAADPSRSAGYDFCGLGPCGNLQI